MKTAISEANSSAWLALMISTAGFRFSDRIRDFEHSAKVRIPISVLCRLYPRPLNEGQPDLIESGVRYVSGVYGEPLLFKHFPTTVFTSSK
jgi:hypothetical protein